jgi:hypothetical protein
MCMGAPLLRTAFADLLLLVCVCVACAGFEAHIRSRAPAGEANQLLRAVLDTAMRVRSRSCPSVKLRGLALSVVDIRQGRTEPLGWPAKEAWREDSVARKVRRGGDVRVCMCVACVLRGADFRRFLACREHQARKRRRCSSSGPRSSKC